MSDESDGRDRDRDRDRDRYRAHSRDRKSALDLSAALKEALPEALKEALPAALSDVLKPIQAEQERFKGELKTVTEKMTKQADGVEAAQRALAKMDTAIKHLMSNNHPLRAAEKAAMTATAHMSRITGFGGDVAEKTKADFLLDYCKQKFPKLKAPTVRQTPYAVVLSFDHASDAAKFCKFS